MACEPERMYLTHYCKVENPDTLVGALHEEIDAYVDIALSCDDGERENGIRTGLEAFYLERLRRHGSRLSEPEIHRLLDMDLGLCAQGLAVWLQRRENRAA
jgi:hypothetical protein